MWAAVKVGGCTDTSVRPIPEPEVAVVQRVDRIGEAKSLPYSTVDATADAIVGEGVATAAEVQAALASLAEFGADPNSLSGSPRVFQAWALRTSE